MKIINAIKTGVISTVLTSCSYPQIAKQHYVQTFPRKSVTTVLDSLSQETRNMLTQEYKQFGKDTLCIKLDDISNPSNLMKRLKNIANFKNPDVIKKAYHKSCDCLEGKKLFSETLAVLKPEKIYKIKKSNFYYVPVEYYGKK